ncbi:hypothetical protein [Croceiramulus getboli]|nr:hypothetical protein P8624_10460 [Flavobacteriaceae bacterium YJPT1-3]
MASVKIEQLLEAYFEGETTLEQEVQLRDYFTSGKVAPHLEPYKAMFSAFAKAQSEQLPQPVRVPASRRSYSWIAIAATVVLALGFYFQSQMKPVSFNTYEDPEVAALKAKQALLMLSNAFEQGTDQLEVLEEFEKTTNTYLK